MNEPKVSVIIPHYSEDKSFLHLCVDSLLKQTYPNVEIIVSSSSAVTPTGLHPRVQLIQSQERLHYAEAINHGVTWALAEEHEKPKYLILGNDDTIYSKAAIEGLVEVVGENDCILNGLSNCDNGFLYFANQCFEKDGKQLLLKRQMKCDEIKGFEDKILDAPLGAAMFIPCPMVCFYATMIPTKTWHKLGPLDEQFVTAGFEDSDYCLRASANKIAVGWTPRSFIFHFSGSTTNLVTTTEERVSNQKKFNEKHNIV